MPAGMQLCSQLLGAHITWTWPATSHQPIASTSVQSPVAAQLWWRALASAAGGLLAPRLLFAQRNLNREPEPHEGEYCEDEWEGGEWEDVGLVGAGGDTEEWAELDVEMLDEGDDWEMGEGEEGEDGEVTRG
ncbi:hypothetical protein FOA52_008987 [Chlamydomonas sp. UWO 241]|nr:hypothetical protein FOA52_008987 [Chlamydomonas sp. UWO 241]